MNQLGKNNFANQNVGCVLHNMIHQWPLTQIYKICCGQKCIFQTIYLPVVVIVLRFYEMVVKQNMNMISGSFNIESVGMLVSSSQALV